MLDYDMKDQMTLFGTIDPPAQDKPKAPMKTKGSKAPAAKPEEVQKPVTRMKPATASVRNVTGKPAAAKRIATVRNTTTKRKPVAAPKVSGAVPDGDVRLTANIRQDLHLRLKIEAAHRRTTIGELIEEFVEQYL